MAHRRRHDRHYRRNPGPVIMGQDTGDLAAMAGGLALAGALDEQIAKPLTSKYAASGGTAAKLLDVVTTGVSAMAGGWGVGLVNKHVGSKVTQGGMVLAAGRFLGTFIPGLGISSTVPSFVNFGRLTGATGVPAQPATGTAAAALPAASQPVALGSIGARSAGF